MCLYITWILLDSMLIKLLQGSSLKKEKHLPLKRGIPGEDDVRSVTNKMLFTYHTYLSCVYWLAEILALVFLKHIFWSFHIFCISILLFQYNCIYRHIAPPIYFVLLTYWSFHIFVSGCDYVLSYIFANTTHEKLWQYNSIQTFYNTICLDDCKLVNVTWNMCGSFSRQI